MATAFNLPPGDEDVVDKLALNGQFVIERGGFTDPGVQQKIDTLSQRASGKVQVAKPSTSASTFAGQFVLDDSVLAIPAVSFDVPGAVVELKGNMRSDRRHWPLQASSRWMRSCRRPPPGSSRSSSGPSIRFSGVAAGPWSRSDHGAT